MTAYSVRVPHEDGFWVAVVPGIRGAATEVRKLRTLEGEVRDLISGPLDVDENSFDLVFDYADAVGVAADEAVEASGS